MLLDWFPKLKNASDNDKMNYELWADGNWIHWEAIGEDLGVDGFFTFKKKELKKV